MMCRPGDVYGMGCIGQDTLGSHLRSLVDRGVSTWGLGSPACIRSEFV